MTQNMSIIELFLVDLATTKCAKIIMPVTTLNKSIEFCSLTQENYVYLHEAVMQTYTRQLGKSCLHIYANKIMRVLKLELI